MIYRIIDQNNPNSKFFVSCGLKDWTLRHHKDVLKIEKYITQHLACKLVATEYKGDERNE